MSINKTVKIKRFRLYYFAGLKSFDLGIAIAKRDFHLGAGFFSVGVEW